MEIVENAISEAPLQRENKLLIGQTCVLEMIAAGAPLNETLTALTQFIEAQEDDLRCSILIVDDDGERFRRSAGPSLPESFHQALDGALVTSPYLGSCGEAAYHGRPVVVKDVATEQRYAEAWRALMLDCGVQACYSFPVRGADGNVLASFAVHRSQPGDPSPARPQLMEIATHLAGIAIERERSAVALRASKARQATELAATQQLQEFSTLRTTRMRCTGNCWTLPPPSCARTRPACNSCPRATTSCTCVHGKGLIPLPPASGSG
jgi:GAF domain-containing protein